MGLLEPLALAWLGLVPVLALAYLVRRPARPVVVSSIIPFRMVALPAGARARRRPRFDWRFALEAAILALAALALAKPYLAGRLRGTALVLDNSALMQAAVAGQPSGFAAAGAAALGRLRASDGPVALYLTAPTPRQVAGSLAVAEAAAALARLRPCDAPDDPEAVAQLLRGLLAERRFRRIVFVSRHRLAAPAPRGIEAITVGGPQSNYALTAFELEGGGLANTALQAHVSVANFGLAPATLEVSLEGDGKSLGRTEVRLAGRQMVSVRFPAVAAAQVYRARLKPDDGFALDNVAYAVGRQGRELTVVFVSPTPEHGASLALLPGVKVRSLAAASFSPADFAGADLAVFEYAVPRIRPPVDTMLVVPPAGDLLFGLEAASAAHLRITEWPQTDPLTESVNADLLDPGAGEYFLPHRWLRTVARGARGGLILAGRRWGRRFVVLGFDPFPYRGRRNLPLSVLTLNVLAQLGELGGQERLLRTGQPWRVPSGVTRIMAPDGSATGVREGSSFTPALQGVYRLLGPEGTVELRAVNLGDPGESDLEEVAPLALGPKLESASPPPRVSLAGALLWSALALALFEALLLYRRRGARAVV